MCKQLRIFFHSHEHKIIFHPRHGNVKASLAQNELHRMAETRDELSAMNEQNEKMLAQSERWQGMKANVDFRKR